MNREQKEVLISDLKDMFSQSQAAFLVNYKGLTVGQMQELRRKLRKQDAFLKIAKARLMRLAAADVEGADNFSNEFKDQVGLVFALKEAPATAKEIVNFSKDNEELGILAGFFESKFVSKGDVAVLASVPSREILLAQLARAMQSPVAGFATVLNMVILKLLYALQEVAKKKEA
ncbi:50S ribosomal protein L10 [Candidatus Babeliales bacterium]|nr:50S ribosomal protein L10 [Candidatus Babeliales bacterium]